jgi:FkbM family methyltransferase
MTTLSRLIRQAALGLEHGLRLLLDSRYRELSRIGRFPRYTRLTTRLLGKELQLVDGLSFYHSYREIFENGIYTFQTSRERPLILDCGANIGLSVIFFKRLFPRSKIIAFEADPAVFAVLESNVRGFGFADVTLVNQAVWTDQTVLEFWQGGADAGRLARETDRRNCIRVPTVRLRDYLTTEIDLLKLDIEGSETEVLRDCAERLTNVQHLFVEYHSFANEPQQLDEVLSVVRQAGFRYQVQTQAGSPRPFCDYLSSHGMDNQLNIFAYRPASSTPDEAQV